MTNRRKPPTKRHSHHHPPPSLVASARPVQVRTPAAHFWALFVWRLIFNASFRDLPGVPLKIMGFYELSQPHRRKAWRWCAYSPRPDRELRVCLWPEVLALARSGIGAGFPKKTWFTLGDRHRAGGDGDQPFGFCRVTARPAFTGFTPRHRRRPISCRLLRGGWRLRARSAFFGGLAAGRAVTPAIGVRADHDGRRQAWRARTSCSRGGRSSLDLPPRRAVGRK